jgi:L-histidine Nalpha-methyltransferase
MAKCSQVLDPELAPAIEMHLESTREPMVLIAAVGRGVHFVKCETVHTENSCKFSDESIGRLLRDSCLEIERTWKDEHGWSAVTLARPHDPEEHV